LLAPLAALAEAGYVAAARRGRQLGAAIGRQHGCLRALGDADEVAEREGRELQGEIQDLRPPAASLAPGRLLELARERGSLAPLRLELETLGCGALHGLLGLGATRLGARQNRRPRPALAGAALCAGGGRAREAGDRRPPRD